MPASYIALGMEMEERLGDMPNPAERIGFTKTVIDVYLMAFGKSTHEPAQQLSICRMIGRVCDMRDSDRAFLMERDGTGTEITTDRLDRLVRFHWDIEAQLPHILLFFLRNYGVVMDHVGRYGDDYESSPELAVEALEIVDDSLRGIEVLAECEDSRVRSMTAERMSHLRSIRDYLLELKK